ncbi:MAG TPA: winged helix-turn-helix domain-containing protein [Bryobacteraceae bacterium]|nr:winged helix-turn-helix domain-containing protein [Bryobacteraceae bacterium]
MDTFLSAIPTVEPYEDYHLRIDFDRDEVRLDGVFLRLPRKEIDLLGFLVRRSGQLISRETLLLAIWGYGAQIRTRTLDVHIRRLRKNLGRYGKMYIETVFGIGYRFQPCRTALAASARMALVAHGGADAALQEAAYSSCTGLV